MLSAEEALGRLGVLNKACAVCGCAEKSIVPEAHVPTDFSTHPDPPGLTTFTIRVAAVLCDGCGHVELFSLAALTAEDEV